MNLAPQRVSVILLSAVFALCAYRAATQSFTIDESFTFLRYVDVPLAEAFSGYSANNHVLQTLLMRAFRWMLGKSELVLRIPTLIGSVVFLTAAYRITSEFAGGTWRQPLALTLMVMNPLVLDLQVAARGYALALGLFWWSLYLLWSDVRTPSKGQLWRAGVCAGLSMAANMIFLVPLAVLGMLLLPYYTRRRRFWDLVDGFAGPSIVIFFVFMAVPLSKSAGQFYFGVQTLAETTATLLSESLGMLTGPFPAAESFLLAWGVPGLFAILTGAFLWLMIRSLRNDEPHATLLGLISGVIVLSVGCWILMHRFLGLPYPMTRTALYIFPLIGLAFGLFAAMAPRYLAVAIYAVACTIAMFYFAQLRTGYFNEWRNEAGMKKLVARLAQDARELPTLRQVTAGGSWELEYSLRYYRARYRLHWLNVLDTAQRKSVVPDYYLLTQDDQKLVEQLHLRVIEKDDASGTMLARRS